MDAPDLDRYWMEQAIRQASLAAEKGEVPVGAVLVRENTLLASGGNAPITTCDPTAHAEIVVLRKAAEVTGNYRLSGAILYVTLEPCIMCAGALLHARISRIVYGASDPKTGALDAVYRIGTDGKLNHRFEITGGVLEEQCGLLLKNFFAHKRKKNC